MTMSSFASLGRSRARVESTTAAGTMSQMARGVFEFADEIVERGCAGGAFFGEGLHVRLVHIEHDAFVSAFLKAANHVRAHSTETNHSELHWQLPPEILSNGARSRFSRGVRRSTA